MATTDYRVIGTRPIRHDGTDKVTGRAKYGGDTAASDLLYAKILRSPHAHAKILSIDTSKAAAHPGVRGVITGKDLPELGAGTIEVGETPSVNAMQMSTNVMARDKALYKGHAIAAVVATSVHIAEEALAEIEVQYEVLPHVMDVRESMADGAPTILEQQTTTSLGKDTGKKSNIATHTVFEIGDTSKGFADADLVFEREFTTSPTHQGYIEPQSAMVLWNTDDDITIWTSNQGPFGVRTNTALLLDVPLSSVKVIPMEIGGGFGGKIPVYLEPLAALLSKQSGHPVKMTLTRTEVLEATGPTPGSYMKAKIGVKNDGTIVAGEAYLAFAAGAFPGSAVGAGAMCMFTPYEIENIHIDAYDVLVNKPKVSAYRAPGAPQGAYAVESLIDEICASLNMDPVEFRMKNAAKQGTRQVTGVPLGNVGNVEMLEAVKNSDHYNAPLGGPNRGRGVASGFWFNAGMQSSATLQVNPDGTVGQVTGSVDIGGTRAATAMQAAEVLGLDAHDVKPVVADTNSIGYTAVTGGSRTAFATGWATYEAANDIVRQMKERAAKLWETDASDVEFDEGKFTRASNPEQEFTFKALAGRLMETGGPVVGKAEVTPPGVGAGFGHHIVDVEVDPETGKTDVVRYTAFQDVGKAIHPSYVEGQIQGGAVQGIGWALNEEYYYNDSGVMANSSFLDYRMPTSLDLPMIDTVLVEVPNPGHPYGARGVGEVPLVPGLAAISNAVNNAIGTRLSQLPMKPGNILEALGEIEG